MTDDRTTELRVKLTERGVEWTKPKSVAEFIQTTFLCNGWGIEVLERNIGLCVTATNVFDTPDQVIAATLGSERELIDLAHNAWSMALCAMQGMPIPAKWGDTVERGLRKHGINVDEELTGFEVIDE